MSYQQWKELKDFRKKSCWIYEIENDIRELESKIYNLQAIRYNPELKNHNGADKISEDVAKLIDKKEEYKELIETYIEEKTNVNEIISICEDAEEQIILRQRYVEDKLIKEIAGYLNKSESYVYTKQKQAKDKIINN